MNNKPTQVSPQNDQFGINNEALSVETVKQEFFEIIDDFIKALKNTILVDLDKENVDIVDALLHNVAIKNGLTFNDFSKIFGKDLRSPHEVNSEILNEINAFVYEYSEFSKGGYLFRYIFHKQGNKSDIGFDHKAEIERLIEVMSYGLCREKHEIETNGKFNPVLFHREKSICEIKLDNLSEIDLNIPGYIALLIFRNILNEQENVKDFLSYASVIQNSFTIKDTAFGERIDEFFLKHSTVESTVDRVSESVSNIRIDGGNILNGDEVPY